jgi:hypothetical protein
MGLNLPPQQEFKNTAEFIAPVDTGLDQERIGREVAELAERQAAHEKAVERLAFLRRVPGREQEAGKAIGMTEAEVQKLLDEGPPPKPPTHPFVEYYAGTNRFDLDAKLPMPTDMGGPWVAPREYVIGTPVIFVIRRLTAKENARCNTLLNMPERIIEGWLLAAKLGCTDIIGGEDDGLVWSSGQGGLADSVLDRLSAVPGLITQIGSAVLTFGRHITAIEKKH